jgi:hypothetical protein
VRIRRQAKKTPEIIRSWTPRQQHRCGISSSTIDGDHAQMLIIFLFSQGDIVAP